MRLKLQRVDARHARTSTDPGLIFTFLSRRRLTGTFGKNRVDDAPRVHGGQRLKRPRVAGGAADLGRHVVQQLRWVMHRSERGDLEYQRFQVA